MDHKTPFRMFKNQRFRNIVGNLCTTSRDLDRYSSCNSCDTKTLCYSDYRPLCHYCAMLQRAINNLEINNYIVSANSYCFKNNIWNPDMKTSILSNSVNILHTKNKEIFWNMKLQLATPQQQAIEFWIGIPCSHRFSAFTHSANQNCWMQIG